MAWSSSVKFCTLNDTISRPIFSRSGEAFFCTDSANCLRLSTISLVVISPTISRMLPSSTSVAFSFM